MVDYVNMLKNKDEFLENLKNGTIYNEDLVKCAPILADKFNCAGSDDYDFILNEILENPRASGFFDEMMRIAVVSENDELIFELFPYCHKSYGINGVIGTGAQRTTLLHLACAYRNIDFVRYVLRCPYAQVSVSFGHPKYTPLYVITKRMIEAANEYCCDFSEDEEIMLELLCHKSLDINNEEHAVELENIPGKHPRHIHGFMHEGFQYIESFKTRQEIDKLSSRLVNTENMIQNKTHKDIERLVWVTIFQIIILTILVFIK